MHKSEYEKSAVEDTTIMSAKKCTMAEKTNATTLKKNIYFS